MEDKRKLEQFGTDQGGRRRKNMRLKILESWGEKTGNEVAVGEEESSGKDLRDRSLASMELVRDLFKDGMVGLEMETEFEQKEEDPSSQPNVSSEPAGMVDHVEKMAMGAC